MGLGLQKRGCGFGLYSKVYRYLDFMRSLLSHRLRREGAGNTSKKEILAPSRARNLQDFDERSYESKNYFTYKFPSPDQIQSLFGPEFPPLAKARSGRGCGFGLGFKIYRFPAFMRFLTCVRNDTSSINTPKLILLFIRQRFLIKGCVKKTDCLSDSELSVFSIPMI